MADRTTAANAGAVAAVRGSLVDVRSDARLPPIYLLLHQWNPRSALYAIRAIDQAIRKAQAGKTAAQPAPGSDPKATTEDVHATAAAHAP